MADETRKGKRIIGKAFRKRKDGGRSNGTARFQQKSAMHCNTINGEKNNQ